MVHTNASWGLASSQEVCDFSSETLGPRVSFFNFFLHMFLISEFYREIMAQVWAFACCLWQGWGSYGLVYDCIL